MAPQARRSSPKTAIQLRISLKGHTPTIWRRLLVPGEIKLSKLHSIFQAAMGWEDYHLHLFEIGDRSFAAPDDDFIEEEVDEDAVVFSE
ncbi:MAG: plasmid pRiA4b ORF-3 family protein, partial [Acidimicrobiales bacterium]